MGTGEGWQGDVRRRRTDSEQEIATEFYVPLP